MQDLAVFLILWCCYFEMIEYFFPQRVSKRILHDICSIGVNQSFKMDPGHSIAFLNLQLEAEITSDELKTFPQPVSAPSRW